MNHVLDIEAQSRIALLSGAPHNWRDTLITETPTARATDPMRIHERDNWWNRAQPFDEQGREVIRLVERAGLGALRIGDGQTEEGRTDRPVLASEVAEHQRDKAKRRREGNAVDEGEEWREYLGDPKTDARAWLAELGKKLDLNSQDNRGFFSALKGHIDSKPTDATCADLSQPLVELCLTNICAE